MIYFIKHIDIEGPGTFGTFLKRKKIDYKVIDLGAGEPLPQMSDNIDAVIILGGPMNVYEEDKYSFLKAENEFIKKVLVKRIPFMGICLGSQLLSKACGATVVKSPVKEVGFFKVVLTRDGANDALFKGMDKEIDIYHWHEDMFNIPSGGKLLVTSDGCPHQAFCVAEVAYGLQFHVEVTDVSINEWAEEYIKSHADRKKEMDKMMRDYRNKKEIFNKTADILYNNFLQIVNSRKNIKNKLKV